MGNLKGFLRQIQDRREVLGRAEAALLELQAKYETFFAEVTAVRERELEQLGAHLFGGGTEVPKELAREVDQATRDAEQAFDEKLEALAARHRELAAEAERYREASWSAEARVHEKNRDLDRQEEKLKERSDELLTRIADFNAQIFELGRGWGFFRNFFRMRELQRTRSELDQAQEDVAARIERLRARWVREEGEWASTEEELREKWRATSTEAAALRTKLDYLESSRARIVTRSALEAVLFPRTPELPEPAEGDPPCPRCAMPNAAGQHFCHVCAAALTEDDPDLAGSLEEIAELNHHFARFSKGMEACQGIIGLVRGLASGHENFARSVEDMLATERKHPVSKLRIDVPEEAIRYARGFEDLEAMARDARGVHPLRFAARVDRLLEGWLEEARIQEYFETMGRELSAQANAQW